MIELDTQSAEFAKLKSRLTEQEIMQGYRRFNMRRLVVECGGQTELAKKLGYKTSTFLTQMVGPTPIRTITENTAREFEQKLALQHLSLDSPAMFTDNDLVDVFRSNESVFDTALSEGKRKYSKLSYDLYRTPQSPLIAMSATPLESVQQPDEPSLTQDAILELIGLVKSLTPDLPVSKVFKILEMCIKDTIKKSSVDKGYVESLVELSK